MKLSSDDFKLILRSAVSSARYANVDPDYLLRLEHQVRYWLLWNRQCIEKGFLGHDKDLAELRLRLRVITAYKNALAKEELAKGF
jgi:hypothetical protein